MLGIGSVGGASAAPPYRIELGESAPRVGGKPSARPRIRVVRRAPCSGQRWSWILRLLAGYERRPFEHHAVWRRRYCPVRAGYMSARAVWPRGAFHTPMVGISRRIVKPRAVQRRPKIAAFSSTTASCGRVDTGFPKKRRENKDLGQGGRFPYRAPCPRSERIGGWRFGGVRGNGVIFGETIPTADGRRLIDLSGCPGPKSPNARPVRLSFALRPDQSDGRLRPAAADARESKRRHEFRRQRAGQWPTGLSLCAARRLQRRLWKGRPAPARGHGLSGRPLNDGLES